MALLDLSRHTSNTVIEGTDSTRPLSEVSAHSYGSFALGPAKQFIPVTIRGLLAEGGILPQAPTSGRPVSAPPCSLRRSTSTRTLYRRNS